MEPIELANLINRHAARLELYARQWCDETADVVQSAFVRLIEQEPSPQRPVAWLFRVVRNEALMQSRSQRRRRLREGVVAETTSPWFETSMDVGLDSIAATEALQELPDDCREVVIAHLWGTLTFEEIGELTGTSSSTAHRRYLEGLTLLRKRLGVSCPNE